MASLKDMFQKYLADIFPKEAEFVDVGTKSFRIIYPIPETVPGQRYSRPIVLEFEQYVIDEFQTAVDNDDIRKQNRIGELLGKIVKSSLTRYDVHEARDSWFKINIDSRAIDQ